MANTSISKSGPVDISALMNMLHTSSSSIPDICTNININPFCLRRPVIYPTLYDIEDKERLEARLGFGFGPASAGSPGYSTPKALLEAIKAETDWWVAAPNSICRIGDFRGYRHDAPQFVYSEGDISFDDDIDTHQFFQQAIIADANETLKWYDIYNPNQLPEGGAYPCLAVFGADGECIGWKTAASKWGSNPAPTLKWAISDGITLQENVEYTYLVCAATASRVSFTSTAPANVKFFPIPCRPHNVTQGKATYTTMIQGVKVRLTGVVGDTRIYANDSCLFLNASDYAGLESMTGANQRLNVGTSGLLALLVEIENTGAVSRDTTYIAINTAPSLAGASSREVPSIIAVNTNSDYGHIELGAELNLASSPITLAPHGKIRLALMLDSLLASVNGGTPKTLEQGLEGNVQLGFEWNAVASTNIYMNPNLLRVTT